MKPYKFAVYTALICVFSYFLLNAAWHFSSTDYKPSNIFFDAERRHEEIDLLWQVYRKGHSEKQ